MTRRNPLHMLFWIALLWAFVPAPAHAYLDPGTGSYVVQILAGTVLGVGFFLKTSWQSIKAKFAQMFSKQNQA
ncbi:MAG: hypothetical protein AB7P76_09350 [Candidatus Melainabacteria bacterium]